ncbi:MAG TPA: hypothetical protein PK400_07650 [Phycisphaerales bacterium]|nr:hypothetical protein [Phycisphaerales bacterium]HRQ74297.1 hypothetical protein [Phycisphaerales bacterium]
MCRRIDAHILKRGFATGLLLVALMLTLLPVRSATGADDVAAYLERHGLTELLAVHLESLVATSEGEARDQLMLRLAAVYAMLLDSIKDDEARKRIEARSSRLLESASEGAEELRLALLRTAYREAERLAEDVRLRRTASEDVSRARAMFAELVPRLEALEAYFDRTLSQIDRRIARSTGNEATSLSERAEQLHQLHAGCRFITAWAMYYQSLLTEPRSAESAKKAERLFAQLLRVEGPNVDPESVSIDLRQVESFARSILGMALCRSLTTSDVDALRWLALLEHEAAASVVREQTPVWRLVVRMEHRRFAQALQELQELIASERAIPTSWLRLIAVYAIEGEHGSREAQRMVQIALAELAARGELQQVLELAERYGVDALGTPGGETGFALHFVRGLLLYREARALHEASAAEAASEDATRLYRNAIEQLRLGLASAMSAEADRRHESHSAAEAVSRRLIAWAMFYSRQYATAWQEFVRSCEGLSPGEASESHWMAIVSLDRLFESDAVASRDASLRTEQRDLMDRFLAEYPSSPHAGTLMLRRAIEAEELSIELAEQLLAIPPHDDAYLPARHRVTAYLYSLYRKAGAAQRALHGDRFLSVAVPLMAVPDSLAARRLVNVRRVLDVSLSERIERLDAAQRALAELERITSAGESVDAIADELDYRRVQERLLAGDMAAAIQIADGLWERASAGGDAAWSDLGSRAMFHAAHRRWKSISAPASGAALDELLHMIVRYGGRIVREFELDESSSSMNANVIAYHQAVAEASMLLFEMHRDLERGRAALFLYQRLLEAQPRNAGYLHAAAVLGEQLGDKAFALDCWRRLAAGQTAGTEGWFEARWRMLTLLADIDIDHARQVMAQHVQLYPDYGPDPWGARLRALHAALSRSGGEERAR